MTNPVVQNHLLSGNSARSKEWVSQLHFFIGVVLLLLYYMQIFVSWEWQLLEVLQTDFDYKLLTGILLFFCIYVQWRLFRVREKQDTSILRQVISLHKWQGIFLPVILFFHTTEVGYGYQYLLTYSLLFTILTGLFSPQYFKIKSRSIYFTWLVLHVLFASLCFILIFYHIYIVFSY